MDVLPWRLIIAAIVTIGLGSLVQNAAGADASCPDVAEAASLSLRSDLFCNYDRQVRPVKLRSTATNVSMYFGIQSLDFEDISLNIYGQMFFIWRDEFLQWNESNYRGEKIIGVSTEEVWAPDIELLTTADLGSNTPRLQNVKCYLNTTGHINCAISSHLTARCVADLTFWPFDQQSCKIVMTSWSHNAHEINLTLDTQENGTEQYHAPHGNWNLVSSSGEIQENTFGKYNFSYQMAVYNFLIKRHARSQVATVVIPALVLVVMTLLIFCLDPGSTERLCLICLNILCHCYFLQHLGVHMPRNGSKPPLIVFFFRDSLVMVGVSLLISLLVRKMHSASSLPPAWATAFASGVLATMPGQVILCSVDGNQKERMRGEVDDTNDESSGWILLARLVDRVTFITFFITFVGLLSALMP